jgi:hypothetical protein
MEPHNDAILTARLDALTEATRAILARLDALGQHADLVARMNVLLEQQSQLIIVLIETSAHLEAVAQALRDLPQRPNGR